MQFDGSVSGLRTGATVLFNGIQVGEVTGLSLDPQHPQQVVATMSVDKAVKVRTDTDVGLEYPGADRHRRDRAQGGSAELAAARWTQGQSAAAHGRARRYAGRHASARATRCAGSIEFIVENQQSFHNALDNIDKFTGALARNSDRIDKIVGGLENLTGGSDGKSGEMIEAVRSIHTLADNLDKRTEEITKGINLFTGAGTKQINGIGADAHRTLSQVEQHVQESRQNPSRLLFGGGGTK